MRASNQQKCPLFPDMSCPRGPEASKACSLRVNGDFDPILYFKDHLVLHCAIHRNQERLGKESTKK
jgi:hypothetical protein